MRKKRGIFLVIEGTDGSGKSKQLKRLVSRLRNEGFRVKTLDFPQYAKPSSYFVREYLNGRYGNWREVGPKKASLFYALDRFAVAEQLRKWLQEGKVVISNRYVASNMGHQGAKINNPKRRRDFLQWVHELEYNTLGIPKPDCNIVLHVPAKVAQTLVGRKGKREYIRGGTRRDIHEADIRHLERAERVYLEMVRLFPKEFRLVEGVERGKLLSIVQVHEEVWRIVRSLLKI
jgi:dTMP kinase